MLTIKIFTAFIFAIFISNGLSMDYDSLNYAQIVQDCETEQPLSQEETLSLAAVYEDEVSDNVKCFSYCLLKRTFMMYENGSINIDGCISVAKNYFNQDEYITGISIKIFKNCADGLTRNDMCARAAEFVACFQNGFREQEL
ncbi:uncharacterized protein LOC119669924 [Teleopsis dalmanni]|uniref:uncharacterized protein LOC119669924 n=1 Tax=Teleopsis dalmanni TaxID=139649 RepID=UPI000D32A306|nr:uncharacterized protein LOC119669924 [Teleopsis dalmanni]